ncbi:AMP-binding protein, partial [Kordia sp. YSTF-M3]
MIDFLNKLADQKIFLRYTNEKLSLLTENQEIDTDILKEVREKKEEIISFLKNNETVLDTTNEYQDIPKVPENESYPLSSSQRRLWLLSQFDGGLQAYNMPSSFMLEGDHDLKNLEKAIYAVINRHEILRTVFKENEAGELRQWILPITALDFKIDYQDFSREVDPKKAARDYIWGDAGKTFDMVNGPLFRITVLSISENAFRIYYNMHHIISDAWSVDVMKEDLFAYYTAYQSGNEVNLSALRIQYKDYASWQLAQQESNAFQGHKNYWSEKLSGQLPLINLPTDKKRPKIVTYNGAAVETYISLELSNKLKVFIEENGGSLFTAMLALWNVLLSKYTSQKDIIIGSPVAGRNHSDLKDQIGFYVNMMALRNEVNSEESFKDFYKRVKDDTLLSFNHQDYPFDQLVEDLKIIRNPDRNPVFDILLDVQNANEHDALVVDTSKIDSLYYTENVFAKYDLQITYQEVEGHFLFLSTFNTDVYDRKLIEDLVVHFKALLSDVLLDTNQSIASLNYLSVAEKTTLLEDFSGIKNIAAVSENVVDLFQAQVLKTPTAVAVSDHEHNYTYEELDRLSNQFSKYLLETHQVGVGSFVGLSLSRDARYIISLLGILKSGCGFVPIDANYPSDRQSFMLKNSGASLLITET